MTLEVLISTMHQGDYSLLKRMKIASDAVVVNQCNKDSREVFSYFGHRIIWINTTERGLSRSRNMAIKNASADICMLADDDLEYRPEYTQIVLSSFSDNNSDIIGFQVEGIEKKFKNYARKEYAVLYRKSMKMASVEIAFRRNSFINNNIHFDEMIGAGTEFLMGEENALLFQCLRKKLKIYYIPKVIADLHIGESTWFTERNEQYFIGKGASFAAMKTPFTILLVLQFAFRKRNLYKDNVTVSQAIKHMLKGKNLYEEKTRIINNDT